jgi:hypothetical protein
MFKIEIAEIEDIECTYDYEKEEYMYNGNIAKEDEEELKECILSSKCNTKNDINSSIYRDLLWNRLRKKIEQN